MAQPCRQRRGARVSCAVPARGAAVLTLIACLPLYDGPTLLSWHPHPARLVALQAADSEVMERVALLEPALMKV